jgi:hypothetical protein
VAWSVARDSVRLFALTRDGNPQVTPITRWQFQTSYPVYPRRYSMAFFTRLAEQNNSGGDLVAARPAADILRSYQLGGGFTPGPLYAVLLALGVLGALSGWRRRRAAAGPLPPGLAGACALVTLAAAVLLGGSDAFEFSWRYQLPALVTLVPAGVLGLSVLFRSRSAPA